MRVRELWRYPVKSMGGERIESTVIGARGIHGDRLWAVRDEARGALTTAKRFPALLLCSARFVHEPVVDVGPGSVPEVEITFPDGTTLASSVPGVHDRLSSYLGRRVTLHPLRAASDETHYLRAAYTLDERRENLALEDGEAMPDFSKVVNGTRGIYATPPGTYFDGFAVHLLTTASLGAWDARRFRANVIVDTAPARGYLEAGWSGATLAIGHATLVVDCATIRCSMPTRAQTGGVPADKSVLATLVREADRRLGCYATPATFGVVVVGDAIEVG